MDQDESYSTQAADAVSAKHSANISRRGLLYGVVGVAGVVALGGAGKLVESDASLLRPPGGQDATAFYALCLKCDKCRSVCPENCLSTSILEDGLIAYRAPKIDFRKGYCTFCNQCIAVCPAQALQPFDPAVEKIGLAVVDTEECLAFHQRGCAVCVEACEYGAITLDADNHPVVDERMCNGCGRCEFECPSGSLGSYSGSRNRGINVRPFERGVVS